MLEKKSIPVTAEIANIEISKYIHLHKEGADVLIERFIGIDEKINFHGSEHNSFVFERKDVLKFFMHEKDIPETPPSGKAELLLVVFGAHPGVDAIEDEKYKPHEAKFEKGQPTVIVAGVIYNENETDENKQISLLNVAEPALEYPPGRTIGKLYTDTDTNTQKLFFNFKFQ